MINLYDNNIEDNVLRQIYNILIENLFITYPDFLKEKNKHDNKENYDMWTNMIKETKNYKVITYTENNKVIGFLNYCIIEGDLWISEVQIKNDYKNKEILKKLIKKFVLLDEMKKYDSITIHINDNNNISKMVFTHIGFKPTSNTLYKISIKDIIKWLDL